MTDTRHETTDDTVVVTGAAGFIASHLVRQLLEAGYVVRGTVRNLARREGYAHLLALPGADARLELVEADLTTAGAFDAVVDGAAFVMHTASPYALSVADPQRDLVDPAVKGTLNVLEACARASSVRRVVLTSSMAAITDEPGGDHVLTEADWNDKSSLSRNPYYFSKAEAEREAWAFMRSVDRGFDLVVVNPFLVIGPAIGPASNESTQVFVDLQQGGYPGILDLTWGFVDVRDVADAHVRAMITPAASGRYICAGDVLSMRQVVAVLRECLPNSGKLPSRGLDNSLGTRVVKLASYTQPSGAGTYLRTHLGRVPRYDASKIQRELGVTFRPATDSIRDTVDDLVARGRMAD
ncbi:MAG: SDR family oxidoreductase [Actinobacteria bacterium]|nr:SDR family oxidoreductase [Actinomycetota bacterium]